MPGTPGNYELFYYSTDVAGNVETATRALIVANNIYTLAYAAGTGGTISGTSPQTVNQGASGTAVTAVANAGYHFVNWSDGSTANPRTDANVSANVSVTAYFAINTYTLTYAAGTGGTISGTSPQTVNQGASGTAVTAVANAGYHFVNWSDGSTANPRTDANVSANVSVTAQFAINTRTLTYTAGTGGTISGTSPQTVNQGASGTAVTAVANAGYRFVKWSDGSTTNARTEANVAADLVVTAQFAKVVTKALVARTPNRAALSYARKGGVCRFTLSAVIKGWGARPAARRYVYLQTSTNGKRWTSTYKILTSSLGKASKSFVIRSRQVRYYRWSVPAQGGVNLLTYGAATKVTVR